MHDKERKSTAGCAYRPKAQPARLAAGSQPGLWESARNPPLTEAQKASNHETSKARSRIEHAFGAQAQRSGHLVRTIGLSCAEVKIGLVNRVYNGVRLGQLLKRDRRAVPTGT